MEEPYTTERVEIDVEGGFRKWAKERENTEPPKLIKGYVTVCRFIGAVLNLFEGEKVFVILLIVMGLTYIWHYSFPVLLGCMFLYIPLNAICFRNEGGRKTEFMQINKALSLLVEFQYAPGDEIQEAAKAVKKLCLDMEVINTALQEGKLRVSGMNNEDPTKISTFDDLIKAYIKENNLCAWYQFRCERICKGKSNTTKRRQINPYEPTQ